MKLPQNTFNQRELLGFALAVDKPTREKDLLLALYLRLERRDFSRMLVSHTGFNYILGRFLTDFMILSSRRKDISKIY